MIHHAGLLSGRWPKLRLSEQLGHVGSEVSRAVRWTSRDPRLRNQALERALELLGSVLADPRWRGRRRELARARELLCAAWLNAPDHGTTLADLDRYFFQFALLSKRPDP